MLRQLWQQVTWYDKRTISPRLYAVLEAVVEAVEKKDRFFHGHIFHVRVHSGKALSSEEIRQRYEEGKEAVEPEHTDATIRKLRVEFWAERRMLQCELGDSRKELVMVHETCDRLSREIRDAWTLAEGYCRELAEAKATLKREREEADIVFEIVQEQRNEATDALEERDAELAEAKAEIERLRPLAENWQLVLGMRQHTSLRCIAAAKGDTQGYYSAKTHLFAGSITVFTSGSPIQALRSIQEVGDDPR